MFKIMYVFLLIFISSFLFSTDNDLLTLKKDFSKNSFYWIKDEGNKNSLANKNFSNVDINELFFINMEIDGNNSFALSGIGVFIVKLENIVVTRKNNIFYLTGFDHKNNSVTIEIIYNDYFVEVKNINNILEYYFKSYLLYKTVDKKFLEKINDEIKSSFVKKFSNFKCNGFLFDSFSSRKINLVREFSSKKTIDQLFVLGDFPDAINIEIDYKSNEIKRYTYNIKLLDNDEKFKKKYIYKSMFGGYYIADQK